MSTTLRFLRDRKRQDHPILGWKVGDLCEPSDGTHAFGGQYRVTDITLKTITLDRDGQPVSTMPKSPEAWVCLKRLEQPNDDVFRMENRFLWARPM